jgi:hypothetical protein
VNVVQRLTDVYRDTRSPIGWQHALAREHIAQQLPFDPFQCHVDSALVIFADFLNYSQVIHHSAYFFLTPEPLVKDGVTFGLGMRNLNCDRLAGAKVRASKYRRHAAARDQPIKPVMVDMIANVRRSHAPEDRKREIKKS